jgi:hypothetical protein
MVHFYQSLHRSKTIKPPEIPGGFFFRKPIFGSYFLRKAIAFADASKIPGCCDLKPSFGGFSDRNWLLIE